VETLRLAPSNLHGSALVRSPSVVAIRGDLRAHIALEGPFRPLHFLHDVVGHGDVRDGVLEYDLVVVAPADVDGVTVEPQDLPDEFLAANQEDRDERAVLADEVEYLVLDVDLV
jgi:hypothetical protein